MHRNLEQLIELARKVRMTPEQEQAQRRSFAYGNVGIENKLVTREMIDRAADRLAGNGR